MRQRSIRLIRHGATALNSEDPGSSSDRIRGWSDVPLTKEGRAQAKKTAAALKDSGIQIIMSSDLKRARDTATEIAKAIPGAEVISTQRLRPWDLGILTGQESKTSLPKIAKYVREPDKALPKGECFNSFKQRAFQGICDAVSGHPGKQVAIVSHHRLERLIEAWTKAGQSAEHDVDVAEFLKKGLPPGESKMVKIDRHAAGGDAEGSANAAREEELEGMMGRDEYWADNGKGETHADELLALKRKSAAKAAPARKTATAVIGRWARARVPGPPK
jgi:broad specificity phosphatase PhoE